MSKSAQTTRVAPSTKAATTEPSAVATEAAVVAPAAEIQLDDLKRPFSP